MVKALRLMSLDQDADAVESLWERYIKTSNYTIVSEYDICFPEFLVSDIVGIAKNAIDSIDGNLIINCNNKSDVRMVFNEAWNIFWDKPNEYISWEKEQVTLLENCYCK